MRIERPGGSAGATIRPCGACLAPLVLCRAGLVGRFETRNSFDLARRNGCRGLVLARVTPCPQYVGSAFDYGHRDIDQPTAASYATSHRGPWVASSRPRAAATRSASAETRFFGIVIAMFYDDHGFPHFHARHPDGEAKVRIDNLEVMDSPLGRRQLRLVLAWAELHQEELHENWRRARAGATLTEIEPAEMTGLTPDITDVVVVRHGVLALTFADGLRGEVDVLDRMRGPVFAEARTVEGFGEVTVDTELGTIVWPGGADLAPDTLYERVHTGAWPHSRAAA